MSPNSEDDRPQDEQDGSWIDAQLLQEVLEDGATVVHIDLQPATAKGDNFLSVLYRTRVEYRLPQSEEVRVKNLIVKALPPNEFLCAYIAEVFAFGREIEIYVDVLPRLYAFANARLGDTSFKKFSAGYYNIKRPDTLILDDLKAEGFIIASRRNRLDFAHSKLVVQNLARFHALSFAYTEEHPDYIAQFDDRTFCENTRDRINQFFAPQITSIVQEIREWGGFDDIANKLEALRENLVCKLIEVRKPINPNRNVLIHADCWINNILFKYSEGNQPIELRFIDFQQTHASSPAIDLNYFLFSSLQSDVREKHWNDLLHVYCDEFEYWTATLGVSGSPITFEEITQELRRTLLIGFAAVLTTMAIVLADPDDSPDMANISEEQAVSGEGMNMFEKVYKCAAFREAFQNVLPYFNDRGVFD